jgi:tRNA (guanosine-2'-O-)-methyltransferase
MSSQTPDAGLLQFLMQYLTPERKALLERNAAARTRHFTVVLEDIFHSHNAGAVLRNCDCFGIQDVHIIENRYTWSKHPQIELGSGEWLNIYRHKELEQNTEACLSQLRSKGYRIVATTPHTECTIDDIDIAQPIAFVFGAEKRGISQEMKQMADITCKIPMYGFTESFNVSVAVALTLHAMRRRMKTEVPNWGLSEDEKTELFIKWTANSIRHHDKYVRAYYTQYKGQ